MSGRYQTRIVLLAGLPGTGKTALSEALARRLGGIVLNKDRVRAELFPPGAIQYSSRQNDFVMSVVLMAAQRIAADRSVPYIFLDGRTFSRTRHVRQVADAARLVGAGLSILHLHCPEHLALARLKRDQGRHIARNRGPLLYFSVKSHFEPITLPKLDVDTSQPIEDCMEKCAQYLEGR